MEYFVDQDFKSVKALEKGEYESCYFKSCNFEALDLSSSKFIECRFEDCDLSNVKLHKTSFQETEFQSCKMLGMHFDNCLPFNFSIFCAECQLDQSVFYDCDLSRSRFNKCSLKFVDFAEANMRSIDLTLCDLMNSIFDQTNLEDANLEGSYNIALDPEKNKIKNALFSKDQLAGLLQMYKIRIS